MIEVPGLSMGGWHSWLYPADHPERVQRIIIADLAPEPSPKVRLERTSQPATRVHSSDPTFPGGTGLTPNRSRLLAGRLLE